MIFIQNCRKHRKIAKLYSTKNRKFEGKVPANILSSVVFPNLGVSNEDVLVGSKLGVDGALISTFGFSNACPIVVTSDPITGATADLGMN